MMLMTFSYEIHVIWIVNSMLMQKRWIKVHKNIKIPIYEKVTKIFEYRAPCNVRFYFN